MTASLESLSPKTRFFRTVSFLLLFETLFVFCFWQVTRNGGPSYFFWVVQCLPILIFIPGMLKNNPRTFILLCFVLLAYFVPGVTGSMASNAEWIDFAILGNSILLFISAMLTSRWLAIDINNSSQAPQGNAEL